MGGSKLSKEKIKSVDIIDSQDKTNLENDNGIIKVHLKELITNFNKHRYTFLFICWIIVLIIGKILLNYFGEHYNIILVICMVILALITHFSKIEKSTKIALFLMILSMGYAVSSNIQSSIQGSLLQNTIELQTNEIESQSNSISDMNNVIELQNDNIINMKNQIRDLSQQLDETRIELDNSKKEIIDTSNTNTGKILVAMMEAKSFGYDNETREELFQTKFNLSYNQSLELLNYVSKNDDYGMGVSYLLSGIYPTSLYHFNIALIKDPTNIEAKIGKSIALIGIGNTTEARIILFEIEKDYPNKKLIYNLLGDSYCMDENYSKCTEYRFLSLGHYFTETGKKDIEGLRVLAQTCEIKSEGKFDSPWISIDLQPNWKTCEVKLRDFGIAIGTKYLFEIDKISFDYIFVRKYMYPEPTVSLGPEQTTNPKS